jgi:hypothetical protein
MKFKDKVVLITGANRGMGEEFVNQILKKDPKKIIMVNRTSVGELKDNRLEEINLDLSEEKAPQTVYDEVKKMGHTVDVLINNAGILSGGYLNDQENEKISKMMKVNLEVPILLSKLFLKDMKEKNSGVIINNSSVSGVMTLPGASTYAASKAGLRSFANALREELLDTKIQVVVMVTPGVKTRMYDQINDDFSKNLDLSFLSAVTPEHWVGKTLQAVEDGDLEVRPSGSQNFSLHLAEKAPVTFRKLFRRYIKQ